MSKKDPRLTKNRLEGFNKPKKTPSHPTKSHVVLAKKGDKIKLIRFGQQGVTGAVKILNQKRIKPEENRIMPDTMHKIPTQDFLQLDTGHTALNGKQ